MRLSSYEKNARREIERWHHSEASAVAQALNWAMKPLDWAANRISPDLVDQVSAAIERFLAVLNDASEWTYDANDVIGDARQRGLDVDRVEDLRDAPMEDLDALARTHFSGNAILAAIEGGGTGLGGAAFIAADIPLLFTINFRLLQQISACYGFPLKGPAFRPLLLSTFNVAASNSPEAKHAAMREVSVAAAAFAHALEYRGRVTGTFREQNRHLLRELAKNLVGRKVAQMVPVAGAAVGAGVNYWFTSQTAEASYMLSRALYLEYRERL